MLLDESEALQEAQAWTLGDSIAAKNEDESTYHIACGITAELIELIIATHNNCLATEEARVVNGMHTFKLQNEVKIFMSKHIIGKTIDVEVKHDQNGKHHTYLFTTIDNEPLNVLVTSFDIENKMLANVSNSNVDDFVKDLVKAL